MAVIDADCHVIECEETWEYMEGEDRRHKPRILEAADQSDPLRRNDFWLFDSNLEPKRAFPPASSGTTPESSELRDVAARLRHMDELGTDIQVLYPTTLLGLATLSRPRTQIAMCRAYNRWMADIWRQSKGRLRWVATLPLLTMDVALEELRFSRDNGACGFLLQGLLGERIPIDEDYFPVYAEASRLDMAVCIHSGLVNHALSGLFHSRATALWMAKVPIITAFHSLVLSRVPDRFPTSAGASSKPPPPGSPTSSPTSAPVSTGQAPGSWTKRRTCCAATASTSPARPKRTSLTSCNTPVTTTSSSAPTTATRIPPASSKP